MLRRPAIIILALLAMPTTASGQPTLSAPVDLSDDRVVAPGADLTATPRPAKDEPVVVFLNYDGVTLTSANFGEEDATSDTSAVCPGTISAYGSGAKRDASVQATRKDWQDFNLQIVTERPASGSYTMNVVGIGPCGPSTGGAGVAPMDCGNQEPSNVSFTWAAENQQWSADVVATINSQEIAHTFGLDHVSHPPDIMNPIAGMVADPGFLDECLPLTGNVFCSDQHAQFCSGGGQNAVQELLDILGPAVPDLAPPEVSITSPVDGEVFDTPISITVTADASDDVSVTQVDILIDGEDQGAPRSSAPYSWPLELPAEGTLTFEVVALDGAGNTTVSDPVTVHIGVMEAPETSDGSGGEEEGSGGLDSGTDGAIPGFGQDEPTTGCGCRTHGKPPLALFGLFAIGCLALRRREVRGPWSAK